MHAIAAEVVMVSPSNTSPQFTKMDKKGFYARTAPSDLLQGDVLASLLIEDGVSTVSIISRADSYGRGLAEATAAAFRSSWWNSKDNCLPCYRCIRIFF